MSDYNVELNEPEYYNGFSTGIFYKLFYGPASRDLLGYFWDGLLLALHSLCGLALWIASDHSPLPCLACPQADLASGQMLALRVS